MGGGKLNYLMVLIIIQKLENQTASHSDTLDAKIWQREVWGMQPDSKTGKRRHREAAKTSADEKTLDQSKDLFEGKTEGFIPNRLAVCS